MPLNFFVFLSSNILMFFTSIQICLMDIEMDIPMSYFFK